MNNRKKKIKTRVWALAFSMLLMAAVGVVSLAAGDQNATKGINIVHNGMVERNIGNGAFVYSVPEAWTADTVEGELPSVPGYQYKLNALSGEGKGEYLFFFYVEKKLLNDDKADLTVMTREVQKAIVRNIMQNKGLRFYGELLAFLKADFYISQLTINQTDYTIYTGEYKDKNKEKYVVDFAFLPCDNRGMRAVLYVRDREQGRKIEEILAQISCSTGN